jgi:hypothetical protein
MSDLAARTTIPASAFENGFLAFTSVFGEHIDEAVNQSIPADEYFMSDGDFPFRLFMLVAYDIRLRFDYKLITCITYRFA